MGTVRRNEVVVVTTQLFTAVEAYGRISKRETRDKLVIISKSSNRAVDENRNVSFTK